MDGEVVGPTEAPLRIGDAVAIKPRTRDPDTGEDISGWQGRLVGFDATDPRLAEIAWDSITLRGMRFASLVQSEVEGLDWGLMVLPGDELVPATPRDTEQDAAQAQRELEARIQHELDVTGLLHAIGDRGKPVLELLDELPTRDKPAVLLAWHRYLQQALKLPFIAEMTTNAHRPLHRGDRVTAKSITRLDDEAGTMVSVQHKRGVVEIPLAQLTIRTPSAANHQLLEDYAEWYENR